MSMHDDDQAPPRFLEKLLRVCCASARREEIAGDLHELYLRRRARSGRARATLAYVLEVLDVCMRQGLTRMARAGTRPIRLGTLRVFPLRILAFLALGALLMTLIPAQRPWLVITRNTLLILYPLIELIALAMTVGRRAVRPGATEPD